MNRGGDQSNWRTNQTTKLRSLDSPNYQIVSTNPPNKQIAIQRRNPIAEIKQIGPTTPVT